MGDKFESVPELAAAKSLLLDLVRGQVVDSLNLAGLDRVLLVVARDDRKILLRQYSMKYKKSGGRVPRVALTEMGPSLDLGVRRCRLAPTDQMKEALRQPQLGKKKV